jgi:ferritin
MLKPTIENALNKQINAELYSAYLYYSMAADFSSRSLTGCAHWMNIQALEEMGHAQKFVNFVNERGGHVALTAIGAPPVEWSSPLVAFEDSLAHEGEVTALINSLVDLSVAESDHATNNFLQWFVEEQVEEEAAAGEVVDKMKLIEGAAGGLFLLDAELGKRPAVLPPTLGLGAATA